MSIYEPEQSTLAEVPAAGRESGGAGGNAVADALPPLRTPAASAGGRLRGSPSHHGIAPVTGRDLYERATSAFDYVWYANERHEVLASRWDLLDTWSRLAVALAASLSAVSLFAENTALTAVLAVVTAVVSALNAAWEPAQRSAQHRRAAKDYQHLERPFMELTNTVRARLDTRYISHTEHDSQGNPYEAGWYEPGEIPAEELKTLSDELSICLDEMDALEENAPPLNRLFRASPDGLPRTKWGLWRMKRQLSRHLEGTKIRDEYDQQAQGRYRGGAAEVSE